METSGFFVTFKQMEPTLKRFFRKVFPEPNTGCFLWAGTLNEDGYGRFRVDNKTIYAHRFSFIISKEIPPKRGELVCHTCDNPSCVNPDHLFLGTTTR